ELERSARDHRDRQWIEEDRVLAVHRPEDVQVLRAHPPSDSLVNSLAATFATTMTISDLVAAILLHDEFWSATSRWALVKSPVEFVVDVLRRIGQPSTVAGLPWAVEGMGQALFNPPNVAGWGQNAYWLSTATAWARGGWLSNLKWQLDGWNFWDAFQASGGSALPAATA